MAVHVAGDRVVWHIAFLGVWELVGERMELQPMLKKKIGRAPYMQRHALAGAFIGDGFAVMETDQGVRDRFGNFVDGSSRVLFLRAGKEPEVLVETSRRPELTPLDGRDTQISGLIAKDGVLWVLANTEWPDRSKGIKAAGFKGGNPEQNQVTQDKTPGMKSTTRGGDSLKVNIPSWPSAGEIPETSLALAAF